MRVLLTRPRLDNEALASELTLMGVQSISAPLLEIIFDDGPEIDTTGVQALLFTSANGVRAFAKRSKVRDLKALAVGDATAREATALGFTDVTSATGDVLALTLLAADQLETSGGALLHAAGSRIAGDLKGKLEASGFSYRREVLYSAQTPETLPQNALDAIVAGDVDGVLLFSPRTAATFAKLALDAGLAEMLGQLNVYCLSSAVAQKVEALGWAAVVVAERPEQAALLASLKA